MTNTWADITTSVILEILATRSPQDPICHFAPHFPSLFSLLHPYTDGCCSSGGKTGHLLMGKFSGLIPVPPVFVSLVKILNYSCVLVCMRSRWAGWYFVEKYKVQGMWMGEHWLALLKSAISIRNIRKALFKQNTFTHITSVLKNFGYFFQIL